MAYEWNPQVPLKDVLYQIEESNKNNPNVEINTADRGGGLVNIYVYRIFGNEDDTHLRGFWSIENSHVHMSYQTTAFLNGQQMCQIRRPAHLTMRAPGKFWNGPKTQVLTCNFKDAMSVIVRPGGINYFDFMLDVIATDPQVAPEFADAYAELTETQLDELFAQWNEVLDVVQTTMGSIFGGVPWSLSN